MIGLLLILVSAAQGGEAIGATGALPAAIPGAPAAATGGYAAIASAVVSTVVATIIAFERVSGWKAKHEAPPPVPVPLIPAPPSLPAPVSPEILTRLSSLETRIGAIEKTTETIKDNDRNTGLSLARMEGQMSTFGERFERLEAMLTQAIFRREN